MLTINQVTPDLQYLLEQCRRYEACMGETMARTLG